MNYFRGAVLGVLCILLSNFEAGLAQSTAKSNSSDPLRLTVTVTGDDLKPAAGLPQHLFTVSDDTGVREVLAFSNEDVPISIAIIFDLSRSVGSELQGSEPHEEGHNKSLQLTRCHEVSYVRRVSAPVAEKLCCASSSWPSYQLIILPMRVKDVIRLLEEEGWYLARTRGSHRQFKHECFAGNMFSHENLVPALPKLRTAVESALRSFAARVT
ncbi:MAG TPA: type II toxin-antitoxin system HicA family toxin [Pyrinomonadaceae bacterium]|nr:type II toxin-antitoxin system HicA family toxin [Pyrinomonadaceae bacterium]